MLEQSALWEMWMRQIHFFLKLTKITYFLKTFLFDQKCQQSKHVAVHVFTNTVVKLQIEYGWKVKFFRPSYKDFQQNCHSEIRVMRILVVVKWPINLLFILCLSIVNNRTNKVCSHGCKCRHCLGNSTHTWDICGVLVHTISNICHILWWVPPGFISVKIVHPPFLPKDIRKICWVDKKRHFC